MYLEINSQILQMHAFYTMDPFLAPKREKMLFWLLVRNNVDWFGFG